jgi:hypothetical protein
VTNFDGTGAEVNPGNRTVDRLAAGAKLRASVSGVNASGGKYIYGAWAEAPSTSARVL